MNIGQEVSSRVPKLQWKYGYIGQIRTDPPRQTKPAQTKASTLDRIRYHIADTAKYGCSIYHFLTEIDLPRPMLVLEQAFERLSQVSGTQPA